MKNEKKNEKRKVRRVVLGAVGILVGVPLLVGIYTLNKPLPKGVSIQSEFVKTDDVKLLFDITYEDTKGKVQHEQEIVKEMYKVIDEAKDFLVVDMFLFNDDYNHDTLEFPTLSQDFAEHLIQKKKKSDIPITVLTDPINSFYGTYDTPIYETLRAHGIDVIETDLSKLRDSNFLYAGYYKTYLRFIHPGGPKVLPNALRPMDDKIGVGSYLRLLNFKANHRKTLINEKEAIVASLNPHDGSSLHSNIAVKFNGKTLNALLESEIAALNFSGYDTTELDKYKIKDSGNRGQYEISLVTEGKIRTAIIDTINKAKTEDTLKIGVFYLSDRGVIKAIKDALDRDVHIQMILDINQDAFGNEKNGVPNKPVASELMKHDKPPEIRWYKSHGEQYHAKFILLEKEDTSTLILGSSNFTRRNLKDLNLETDVMIKAQTDSALVDSMNRYFERLWDNEEGIYTLDYEDESEDSVLKTIMYRVQEALGLSTF